MFAERDCIVGQIICLYPSSERSARGPQQVAGFLIVIAGVGRGEAIDLQNNLTRRANHRRIAIVTPIKPAPEQPAAGFFMSKFQSDGGAHSRRPYHLCRCFDARGVLSRRRPNHFHWLARANVPAAAWGKSTAARGPARDKVRAPNDRANRRSCRNFIRVARKGGPTPRCPSLSLKSARWRAAIAAPRSMSWLA
jgi:hypothetical protein